MQDFKDKVVLVTGGATGIGRAAALAASQLPDLVTYDYSSAEGAPNGRNLTDDVINAQIALLSNGHVPSDGLLPHEDLLAEFPFLGSPH